MNRQSLNRPYRKPNVKNRAMANKGMASERLLDRVNQQYLLKGIADIRKLPTPVKIMKVTGSKVEGIRIKGYLVDYLGVYNGRAVAFDMKECADASFPLKNIESHQYDMLKNWHENGALCFLVVYMKRVDTYYRLPFEVLQESWQLRESGGRKSIQQKVFDEHCIALKSQNGILLDYLMEL